MKNLMACILEFCKVRYLTSPLNKSGLASCPKQILRIISHLFQILTFYTKNQYNNENSPQALNKYNDLKNEEYIRLHNRQLIKEIWPNFIQISFIFWIYRVLRIFIKALITVICCRKFEIGIFSFIYNLLITLTPFLINKFIFPKLQKKRKGVLINILLLFYQMITYIYLMEYTLIEQSANSNETLNDILLAFFLFFFLALQRYLSLRFLSLLGGVIYIINRKQFIDFQSIEYIIVSFIVEFIFIWQWDTLQIKLSRFKQIQKDSLYNLPNPLCILNQKATKVLVTNREMKNIMLFKQSKAKSFFNNDFNEEATIKNKDSLFTFFKCINIDIEEVTSHLSNFESKEQQVSLQEVILFITNNSQKNKLSFRCNYQEKIIQVLICTGIIFDEHPTIFLSFSDLSKHLKSVYYKNLNNFKSKLIKSISHELRTRLNIIQGMLEMVISEELVNEKVLEILRACFQNCRIQTSIIGSIMDYNLLRENQLQPQHNHCNLTEIIKDVYGLFIEEAKLKNINFESFVKNDYFIEIDKERLIGCMINLISNSIKFTKTNGKIEIHVEKETKSIGIQQYSLSKNSSYLLHDENKESHIFKKYNSKVQNITQTIHDCIRISVIDTGIGIENEKLQKIKKILSEEEIDITFGKDSEGFMLGIRVVSQLLNYLNKIDGQWFTIDSNVDSGTRASIYLKQPLIRIDSVEQEGSIRFANFLPKNKLRNKFIYSIPLNSSQCECNKQILIVDDEPYNLFILEKIFESLNQSVIKAENGQKCIELVRERIHHECSIFKAIIMDYQMPILNGKEATVQIVKLCQENNINEIPIFGCTGFSAKEDIETLLIAGMQEVFIKPITKKNLQEILEKINRSELLKKVQRESFISYLDGEESQLMSPG